MLCFFVELCLSALPTTDQFRKALVEGKESIDAAADLYEYIGRNLIARGHVVVKFSNLQLTADKVIFNMDSKDLEFIGNVSLSAPETKIETLTPVEFENLKNEPFTKLKLRRYVTDVTGAQKMEVEVTKNEVMMRADRAAGNLNSAVLQFRNFAMKSGFVFCTGARAERAANGTFTVHDAKFTTCEYIMDGHDHYALFARKATMKPRLSNHGLFNYNSDVGEHSIWTTNSFFEIYGLPVLWFPVLYKPADISSFGGKVQFGKDGRWGWFIKSSKYFKLSDEPYLNTNLMFDWYEKRGFGYGISGDLMTQESTTSVMFYGINDRNPYGYWDKDLKPGDPPYAEDNSLMKIPGYRYEFLLTNMTHVMPRLDMRIQLDVLSDFEFLRDYSYSRYSRDLEPPTYINLDYQADWFTASIFANPRVNSFFTVSERLPEIRLDFQRQELFANIYYQGETSLGEMRMKWREYDRKYLDNDKLLPTSLYQNNDYNTFRFDTLHMFYYPLNFFNINIIPRAGVRLTAYSRSSDQKISYDDLMHMFANDKVDGIPVVPLARRYDGNGGSQLRFTGEFGVEANTKFYRTWQDVKNGYFQIDGLRHVMIPYVNYTYIPNPNVSADNLFYFDEIDRIDEQHFVRLGLTNRLQTRRNDVVTEILSIETYWDYFIHRVDGFNNIGDIGVLLRFNPFPGLTLTHEVLFDVGHNNGHDYDVYRVGHDAGRPGFSNELINRFLLNLTYEFAPGWKVFGQFEYNDAYTQRSPYSMSTTFTTVTTSSMFLCNVSRTQQISGGLEVPLPFSDKNSFARGFVTYDVDRGYMRNVGLIVSRKFHCWQVAFEIGDKIDKGGKDYQKNHNPYLAVSIGLSAMPSLAFTQKQGF